MAAVESSAEISLSVQNIETHVRSMDAQSEFAKDVGHSMGQKIGGGRR